MSDLAMQWISLADIRGAEYNPRFLSDDSFETLRRSIRELGVIKPILVRAENAVIIAGHQRTKAMRSEGMATSPAYILHNLNYADEVRFNQLHNACEVEVSPKAPKIRLRGAFVPGQFCRVSHADIDIEALPDYSLEPHGAEREYHTCRNWRFAYQMTHGKARQLELWP